MGIGPLKISARSLPRNELSLANRNVNESKIKVLIKRIFL